MFRRSVGVGILAAAVTTVGGCASYGEGVNASLKKVEKGDYEKANKKLKESLDKEGDDRLLFYLERGTIHHLAGDYKKSNKALEKANDLADDMRSKSGEDYLAQAMMNPRQMEYMGNDVERIYVNYYKALNYLLLAQQAPGGDKRSEYLESAGVEIERLDNKLSNMEFQKGSYEQQEKEEKETFTKLLDLFQKFRGNWLDEEWLVFREDAYVRYLAGVLYEKRGQLDDARIAYRKAAELYADKNYRQQYALNDAMAQQAWLDTVRVMGRAGGYATERQRLIEQKLSAESRQRLESFGPNKGQVVVIQHLGMMPQRKELNLHMTAVPSEKALRLKPVLTGTEQEKEDQQRWFTLLYGDKGVMDMVSGFSEGGLSGVAQTVSQKTVPLGPAWDLAKQVKVPQNIGETGIRVTVPYYAPLRTNANGAHVKLDGREVVGLEKSEAVSQLFVQNQLLNAGADMNEAMARAVFKNVTAAEGASMFGGWLGRQAGKAAASATAAAETRNWLTLPYDIRISRFAVEPGKHDLRLVTEGQSGQPIATARKQISVEAGQTRVWVERTFDPTQERPYEEKGEKQEKEGSGLAGAF